LNAPVPDVSRSDRDAWLEAVLEAHGQALGRLAASYAKDLGEREDLFQEIVVAIWKALPRFRGECSERRSSSGSRTTGELPISPGGGCRVQE